MADHVLHTVNIPIQKGFDIFLRASPAPPTGIPVSLRAPSPGRLLPELVSDRLWKMMKRASELQRIPAIFHNGLRNHTEMTVR